MDETNMLPRFFELLADAQAATAEVDDFDVDSKNDKSMRQWRALVATQREACAALVSYITYRPMSLAKDISRIGAG